MQKEADILTQNHTVNARKKKWLWLFGISSIPLLGIAAAFAIAPKKLPEKILTEKIVEDVVLPAEASASSNNASRNSDSFLQIDQVQRGDTLSTLLNRVNVHNPEAIRFLSTASEAQAMAKQLRPGRPLLSRTTQSGMLLELQFQIDDSNVLNVTKLDDGYAAQKMPLALENRTVVRSAEIQSSLFAATYKAGIPDRIAVQIANIFSSDIDFNTDLRRGDRFTVIFEASYHNGELVRTGRVLGTEFVNRSKTYNALLYSGVDGRDNYYSANGKSLKKAFLRSPMAFSRISSGFSLARFHPILKKRRAHRGVDYAAPIGTPVRAVSDAKVSFVGNKGGYGKVVILQHINNISTVYGHLSRFAPKLRKGQKVEQGQTIGFVGKSGLATGPHLHYEFRVNGKHKNPVKVSLPTATPLPANQLEAFRKQSQPLLKQLALLRNSNLASLE